MERLVFYYHNWFIYSIIDIDTHWFTNLNSIRPFGLLLRYSILTQFYNEYQLPPLLLDYSSITRGLFLKFSVRLKTCFQGGYTEFDHHIQTLALVLGENHYLTALLLKEQFSNTCIKITHDAHYTRRFLAMAPNIEISVSEGEV